MSTQSYSVSNPLVIGTRGSPLALAQAVETRNLLMAAHGMAEDAFEIRVVQTTGDRVQDRPLSEIGGKGLFTQEIEAGLLDGSIHIAVHSLKDVATVLPDGLEISTVLKREDVRDAFISHQFASIDDLPEGAVFGCSSIRRRAQLLVRRPDLKFVEFRGNVQTRLKKLRDGVASATFLARAGLNRLGNENIGVSVDVAEMLPAVAQAAIGIEQRCDDDVIRTMLAAIHHMPSFERITAERTFLRGLDGSCRTPIAALATISGDEMHLTGEVIRPDGSEVLRTERRGPTADAARMGEDAANELRANGAGGFY